MSNIGFLIVKNDLSLEGAFGSKQLLMVHIKVNLKNKSV